MDEPTMRKFETLDHVPLGIFVLRPDLVAVAWNRCLQNWTGIAAEEIVGKDVSQQYPHLRRPQYVGRLESIFLAGAPVIFSSQFHKQVIPCLLPDGRPRIQHTVVMAVPAPAPDKFHALFAIQDISDLTRRVEEYRSMRDEATQAKRLSERQAKELEQQAGELENRNTDLENFTRLASERELRMIELKREVNQWAQKAQCTPPYDLSFAEPEYTVERNDGQ